MLDLIQSNPLIAVFGIIICIVALSLAFFKRQRPDKKSSEESVSKNIEPAHVISKPESTISAAKYEEKGEQRSSVLQKAKVLEEIGMKPPLVREGKEKRVEKAQEKSDLQLQDDFYLNIAEETEEASGIEFKESVSGEKQVKVNNQPAKQTEKTPTDSIDFQIPEELDLLFMENPEVIQESDLGRVEPPLEEIKKKDVPQPGIETDRFMTDKDLQFLDLED